MDERVRQNLVDAGCSEGFIDDYAAAGSGSEQLAACGSIGKSCSAAYMTASASSIVLII